MERPRTNGEEPDEPEAPGPSGSDGGSVLGIGVLHGQRLDA
jgi:hypothetical protein